MSDSPDKKIKVLLIEDDLEDVLLVRAELASTKAPFEVQVAATLGRGVEALQEDTFDIVLLDLSLPDSRGPESFTKLYSRYPGVPIIVLTGLNSEGLALRLVHEGAQDYLVKGEMQGIILVRSILHAIQRHKAQTNRILEARPPVERSAGKVIGFIGAKGGVGTTTVALNVAAALAADRCEVIALEFGLGPDGFASRLKQNPSRGLAGLLALDPAAIDGATLSSMLLRSSFGPRLLLAGSANDCHGIGPAHAEAIVRAACYSAPFTIIDFPSYPHPGADSAAKLCDSVTIIVDREPVSIRSARSQLVRLAEHGVNGATTNVLVVGRESVSTPIPLEEIHSQLGSEVIAVVPAAPDACAAAARMGSPLITASPDEIATGMLTAVARKLAQALRAGVPADH